MHQICTDNFYKLQFLKIILGIFVISKVFVIIAKMLTFCAAATISSDTSVEVTKEFGIALAMVAAGWPGPEARSRILHFLSPTWF